MDQEEKLRLKRERDKESARESRKRKKQKTEDVKKQITMYCWKPNDNALFCICRLEAANLQLRLQLNVGFQHDVYSENNFIKSQIAGRLNKMLKEGASDEQIQATIRSIQEKYSGVWVHLLWNELIDD